MARRGRRRAHAHIHAPGGSARDAQAPESSARQDERPRDGTPLQPGDGDDPARSHSRGGAPGRRRISARPRRADARRQRTAQRRDLRLDLDGAPGREADGRVLRQEHDRQGRVSPDGRDRDAVREHAEPALARAGRGRGDRVLDDRVERGGDARRARAQAALAAETGRRGQARRPAEPRHGDQRPGLLGEVRELLGRRDAARADGGGPVPSLRRGGREAAATRTRSASSPSSARRSTGPTSPSRRSARPSTHSSRRAASTSPCTSTARPARWSPRSSTPTSRGTSGCRGSRRSTRPGTSTASSTPASAGSSGATPTRSRTT